MTERLDLTKVANPFDFANPVQTAELFCGRDAELDDIRYYLDQAALKQQPMNIALTGERAAGKTSFLNIIQIEAEQRGICVARIDLDEGDASSQLAFFQKLFDSLFTAACHAGAYGGIQGRTYEAYRETIDGLTVPEKKLFCPFGFPIQYAKAMSAGNSQAALADAAFKHDAEAIQTELGRPVALLFDEGDVLSKSRIHLEKLRNIFMNLPGFMLVITGTPRVFPVMDEVFSPIARQFKKISVEPFEKPQHTETCITRALRAALAGTGTNIGELTQNLDVREVHTLAGGRPYEIQLVCHFMFRRIQEGRARLFELNTAVLDDVKRELEKTQDVSSRPVLAAVARYTARDFAALGRFTRGDKRLSFAQAWTLDHLFDDACSWTEHELKGKLEKFVEDGVLRIDEERESVTFVGDDFDRVYAKYQARQVGSTLEMASLPLEVSLFLGVRDYLGSEASFVGSRMAPAIRGEGDNLSKAIQGFARGVDENPFDSLPKEAEEVYQASMRLHDRGSFFVAQIRLNTPWTEMNLRVVEGNPDHAEFSEDIEAAVARIAERALSVACTAECELRTVTAVSPDDLAERLADSDNTPLKEKLSDWHGVQVAEAYIRRQDQEDALFHAGFVSRSGFQSVTAATNVGYLYLVLDKLQDARPLLERASQTEEVGETRALANYNLGVLEAKEGNITDAVRLIKAAAELSSGYYRCARLVIPRRSSTDSGLEFEELVNPELCETATAALLELGAGDEPS